MSSLPPALQHLYPFRPHYLTVGGPRMHYVDEGQGPPVVLLHGNPTWSFYYRDLIQGLRDGHRMVAPDHVGCGLSDKPQRYAYRLTTHIENLERLLEHLKLDDLTLAVHDWGGPIGFGFACRHPERVRRFIIFNTAAFFGRVPLRIRACRIPVFGTLAVRGLNLFARAALRMACLDRQRMTPEVRAGYLFPYRDYASRVALHRFVQDIPTRPAHPTYPAIQSIAAALAQFRDRSMLIAWGMRDFCFTETFLNGWIERFPTAQVHRFSHAGHYVLEDAGPELLPLIRDFLR
ncbi:MAG: alpha/beta fold hydrolase [Planctomycetota bacterium]